MSLCLLFLVVAPARASAQEVTLVDAVRSALAERPALAMAAGALWRSHASLSVAITGIAGPGGGSPARQQVMRENAEFAVLTLLAMAATLAGSELPASLPMSIVLLLACPFLMFSQVSLIRIALENAIARHLGLVSYSI